MKKSPPPPLNLTEVSVITFERFDPIKKVFKNTFDQSKLQKKRRKN